MKKLFTLFILALLPILASADDNQQESLYGEWRLVGWNDGGIWFEVDTNYVRHRHMSIEIMDKENGYTIAYSMVNDIYVGLLTLNGNEMIFSGEYKGLSTRVLWSTKENLFFEDHICDIKFYQLEGKQLKLYYTDNDYFVFTKDFDGYIEQSEYIPFVKAGKKWHVIRSDFDRGYHHECYILMNEKVEKAGKTYMKMYRTEDDSTVVYNAGLLREKNRRVYFFDDDTQKEYLLFDFWLQAGDTYRTYSYDDQKMVSYKVLSVDNYTEGPEVIRYEYDEKGDSMVTHHRLLRKWTVRRMDNNLEKTWIEGAGSLEGPLGNLQDVVLPGLTKDYLAYVESKDEPYLPFSL